MSRSYSPMSYKPDGGDSSDGYSPRGTEQDMADKIQNQYVPSEVGELLTSSDLSDNEYRVEPLADQATPAYSPSRPASDEFEDHAEEPPPPAEYQPSYVAAIPTEERLLEEGLVEHTLQGDGDELEVKSVQEEPEEGEVEEFDGFDGEEEGTKGIIADIFGESDAEEEEEFEGFAENEIEKEAATASHTADGDEDRRARPHHRHQPPVEPQGVENDDVQSGDEFTSDFDRIMSRRREETRRNRRHGRDEFLNDNDEIISETITRMRASADEDRHLFSINKPATKKLKMLNIVNSLFTKADMKPALLDNGILSAITDWLSPLPGQILPNVTIRDTLLRHLAEFSIQDPELLRESGVGKAVMYLYKHPRETRNNKKRAGHLINEWSRPIFNLTSDYRTLSKEERKQLDYEHLPKRRNYDNEEVNNRDLNREMMEQQGPLRPGAPGWVNRARVPQPSNRDYVVRPKWNVPSAVGDDEDDEDEDGLGGPPGGKRRRVHQARFVRKSAGGHVDASSSRIDTHIRNLAKSAAFRKKSRFERAVHMSIEGRKMAL